MEHQDSNVGTEITNLVPYREPTVDVPTLVQVLLTAVYDSVTDPIPSPFLVPPLRFFSCPAYLICPCKCATLWEGRYYWCTK